MKVSIFFLILLTSWSASSQVELVINKDLKTGLEFVSNDASKGPDANTCGPEVEVKTPLPEEFFENGADCSKFIKPDGELGELGEVVSEHIEEMDDSLFFKKNIPGIIKTCPGWEKMSKEEKKYYWVWLFTSLSFKESTCGATTYNHDATHGTAAGMLQLNNSKKDRAWRGGDSGDSCKVKDITQPEDNLKCGIEIMHELLKGKEGLYLSNGDLFGRGSNSYWQSLRKKDGGPVMDLMKEFPYCN